MQKIANTNFCIKYPKNISWVFFMRNTPARLSILGFLGSDMRARGEEGIFEHVMQDTHVNLSTVYRALKDLE